MKVIDPLSGLKLASGHAFFHMAYFLASFSVYLDPNVDYRADPISEEFYICFKMVRWTHLAVFVLCVPGFIGK